MNQLQHETSPYLQQHAHNPVDWYAWKPEAFEKARLENKPILVSIGYSTCHWCHVMERESFENPDIAAFMNDRFVCIKVDREERPDVDAIYMEACQLLTGSGGWPLNCFLTPEGKPFFAGTYYPPRPAYNRPSWLQVLQHLANIWETKRQTAYEQADRLLEYIARNDDVFLKKSAPVSEPSEFDARFPPEYLDNIFLRMREQFDQTEGGFGGAPKFPSTMAIQFLFQYYWFANEQQALEHALHSLDKMIQGGIFDQLGGGFARYSTDREWLVPHFEKMLYDNALLVSTLAEAIQLLQTTGVVAQRQEARLQCYRETVERTLAYVVREMTHPAGGFFSAQDADSEGEEGKFFVWDKAEIEALLGDEAGLFCEFYGVSEAGNWEGSNILHIKTPLPEFAVARNLDLSTLNANLARQREVLFLKRSKRVPPGLDDKVIMAWNALMCSAFAQAYAALGVDTFRDAAMRNLEFLLDNLIDFTNDDRLLHTWKDGKANYPAMLDDYAFFILALLDIWQITFDSKYLTLAERYTEQVLSYFHDSESGLFYYTSIDQTDLVLRKKDLYDNATPSGNSSMALALQRIGILCDRQDWRETAAQMLRKMADTVERYPLSFERWACTILLERYAYFEIALVGEDAFEKARMIQKRFLPNKVMAASVEANDRMPLLRGKVGASDAIIYVCRDYACQKPVQSMYDFNELVRLVH